MSKGKSLWDLLPSELEALVLSYRPSLRLTSLIKNNPVLLNHYRPDLHPYKTGRNRVVHTFRGLATMFTAAEIRDACWEQGVRLKLKTKQQALAALTLVVMARIEDRITGRG